MQNVFRGKTMVLYGHIYKQDVFDCKDRDLFGNLGLFY